MTIPRIGRQAATALCVAGLLAGACSVDQPESNPPIDRFAAGDSGELNSDEQRFLFLTEQELISRCMEEQGFKYEVIPPPPEVLAELAPPPPVDVDERRRIGYGLPDTTADPGIPANDGGPQDANASYAQSLSPERQQQFQAALFGRDDRAVSVEIPDGSTVATNADGCISEARIQLYGDLENWLYLDHVANNVRTEAVNRMRADDRYGTAHEEWWSCMQARGYDYQSPGDARAAVVRMYGDAGADRQTVLAREIEIAVADGECDLETGLSDTVDRLRQAHVIEVQEDWSGEILAYLEVQREALDRAEELLG